MNATAIKALRDRLGLRVQDLAAALNMAPSTVYNWENPKCSRPTGLAAAVLKALIVAAERARSDEQLARLVAAIRGGVANIIIVSLSTEIGEAS